ncbi:PLASMODESMATA CALLOSE-BINDING PROTEIN 3-like [Humulus lupulus]|uniref:PLASMODESMATA CALLOSE-BINDING PROTEIN 3-like n=1 Tax=Humulus lupulus TaxID=3486 RepID=UPI002B401434|nr:PLASMODESMATA CALLOSE-BINDING PROTEIN 3-like [Humulus lupulus]
MAVLAFLVLILAMTGHTSANWCVCKNGISEGVLQKALDYACGAGADCNPIHSNAACYNPNTVLAHCNYAVNSYFQKKGQAQGSCDFAGAATVTASDPSTTGCNYPASASSSSTGTTPVSTTPSTSTGTNTGTGTTPSTTATPSTTSPYSTTPSTGVLGGIGGGMGPTGAGINTDESGGFRLARTSVFSSSVTLFISGLMLWWG